MTPLYTLLYTLYVLICRIMRYSRIHFRFGIALKNAIFTLSVKFRNMDHIKHLTVFLVMWVLFSAGSSAQKKEIFLRKIDFALSKVSPLEAENKFYLTLQFNKDVQYKFYVKNHLKGGPGEAVVEIYDQDRLLGTNCLKEKYFDTFLFSCTKTGMYDVVIRFRDNNTGNSVISIYMIP